MREKDSSLLFQFHASHLLKDGQRVVSLPRKEYVSLSSNYHHAEKRFHALARRRNTTQRLPRPDVNYIRHEQVEITPPADGTEQTYYLSHYLVREEKCGNL
jgi:hypothetical protein